LLAIKKTAHLLHGLTIEHVADGCRNAAIAFIDGVGSGWEKGELARWLVGPYHQLSMLRVPVGDMRAAESSGVFPSANRRGTVSVDDVVRVMWEARDEVLRVVDEFERGEPQAERFVWRLQSRGLFARVEDDFGAHGLVPNETAPQTLADRVLSLIAADYIVRPFDYEDRVAVCRNCGVMTFRPDARAERDCGTHRSPSGIRPRVEFLEMDLEDSDVDNAQVFQLVSKM
jgi:hypothetical protein